MMPGTWRRRSAPVALGLVLASLAACSSPRDAQPAPGPLQVMMVDNPQMRDLQRLTVDHFTATTGIAVDYTILPENEVRERISQEFSSQAGTVDVASVSNFEVPFFSRYGWLAPLDALANDPQFDQADVLPSMMEGLTGSDGRIYAEPFYGESSFLMYRRDVFDDAGLVMPEHPTWQQVEALAAKVDGARPGMRGICLRGLPGWGELGATLTTVVNTFGGTWFDKDWQPELDSPEFLAATQFYVRLVREHGQPDPTATGFSGCLETMKTGGAAMWYDATSAAGLLEAADSPVAGDIGYAPAPVVHTASSGWIYSWAWGIEKASTRHSDAEAFIRWASGREYESLVGSRLGWSRVPAGKRASTYTLGPYRSAGARSFAAATLAAIDSANPRNPGLQPRPTVGVQFVGIPEFTALGTLASEEVAAAMEGRQSVEQALKRSQALAEQVGARRAGR